MRLLTALEAFTLPFLALGTIFLSPARLWADLPSSGDREVVVHAVTTWDGGCDGSTRGSWDDMCWYWYFDLTFPAPAPWGHGTRAWFRDGFFVNSAVDSHFTDPTKVNWGRDYTNDRPDDVDMCMIAMHGGNSSADSGSRWTGQVVFDESGDGNCGTWQGHMDFGDEDLEFLHLSSCVSMDEGDWHPDWSESFKGIHQINGFHGIMYISGDAAWLDRYRDFSDDAFDIPIALAWLDNHYRYKCATWEGTNVTFRKDQCPVSRGVGVGANGEANCWSRMFNEEYDDVFSDPTNPTWHGVIWLEGCNPSAGDALPYESHGCADNPEPGGQAAGGNEGGIAGGEFDELPPLDRNVVPRGGYAPRVAALLPTFDASILDVPQGMDWLRDLSVGEIATALDDTPPDMMTTSGPRTWAIDSQDRNFIKIDQDRGRVRYGNRARRFNWVGDPHIAWPEQASFDMARALLVSFGVPAGEIDISADATNVMRVFGRDYETGVGDPHSEFEAEQMVTFVRRINGLPVMESFARASINNHGKISRALVRWPQFMMAPGMTLRTREQVVGDLANRIQNAQLGADAEIEVFLAYARFGFSFVPVAVAEVLDPYSGQILQVPLVNLPPDRDMDGVPDDGDNCMARPNPRQEDADNDGVGDVCDNCAFTANASQADANNDGVGDACQALEGACSLPDGSCDVLTRVQCADGNGAYAGDGTTCPDRPGDMNCDGAVNFLDIDGFVMSLFNPAGYAAMYPNCNLLNGDMNGDGSVNFLDIDPFIACLFDGNCG